MFGWLCNELSIYPDTHNLKTSVKLRNSGMRPLITLEPTEHPLAIAQRADISMSRVEEIAATLMH